MDTWATLKKEGFDPSCFRDDVDPSRELNLDTISNLPLGAALLDAKRQKKAWSGNDVVVADREYDRHDPQEFSDERLVSLWQLFPW